MNDLSELPWNVLSWAICFLPSPLVLLAWLQWRRSAAGPRAPVRRFASFVSLLLVSVSALLCAAFPAGLWYLDSRAGQASDAFYIRGVQLGFMAATVSTILALIAAGRLRAMLAAAGALAVGAWFFIGVLY